MQKYQLIDIGMEKQSLLLIKACEKTIKMKKALCLTLLAGSKLHLNQPHGPP